MQQDALDSAKVEFSALIPVRDTTENRSHSQRNSHAGLPATKSRFTGKDGVLLAIVFLCFGVAVGSVFSQKAAVHLGQTNQLVIVGFCLSVMALVCQRQVLFAFLLRKVYTGSVSLQDLEAVLSNSAFISRSSYTSKGMLLFLSALPLGLGVAYKRFVGGSSTVEIASRAALFGFSYPPGYQHIGLGLTMIAQVYLPFWLNPMIGASYSFNLLVHSNDTAALLDIPLPDYVNLLQAGLHPDEAVIITTTVNATVSENVPLSPSLRQNTTYWSIMEQNNFNINLYNDFYGFFGNDFNNHSLAYISIYNSTANQTLGSQVQQNVITRRACKGTWRITSSNITLLDGTVLETIEEARARHNQTLIDNNDMDIANLFGRFAVEYDWHRYPRSRAVNTVPSLTAAMIWSRTVAMCGAEVSTILWGWTNHYNKLPEDMITYMERTTLKRSSLLLVVLSILPVMSVAATTVKVLLYKCPISDGFGLTSILAAVDSRTLSVTRGSGLSGRLSRAVGIHFIVVQSPQDAVDQKIEIRLDETGRSGHLRSRKSYG